MALTTLLSLALMLPISAADPDVALKEIIDYRTSEIAKAREAKTTIDAATLNAKVKSMALEAIKDVKPSEVQPAKGYSWMQLFMMAEKYEDIKALCEKYMESMPDANGKYSAEFTCLQAFYQMGKTDDAVMTIKMIDLPGINQASTILSYAGYYADQIASSQGVEAGVALLDGVKAKIPAATTDADKTALGRALASYYTAKAELYSGAGKTDMAKQVLQAAMADANVGEANLRGLKSLETRITMIGAPAPAVESERGYGNYPGLDGLKGKVVLLDFFAHWCGPCIAAFPAMRTMYDDLKGSGLEIIGITRYYGYYGQERNMDKDTEFAKMDEFMKKHNMNWPVIYDANNSFTSYGITGIPHVTIIDKQGNVRDIKIGYSAEGMKKLRQQVEAMLKE
ncbi:TlpA disulfide reductase family protein [Kamptonema cortianum]|nr:TlpA disulfide reductase family protein [Geitlerinema splendidum]MDK3158669.1 TlpA disulfide reductase family protein [Kamptonema cortianum]